MAIPSSPTNLSLVIYDNKIQVRWQKNPETDVVGYNVYNSTTSGGGLSGYAKINASLVEDYSEIDSQVTSNNTTISDSGNTRTTTTVVVEELQAIYIYTYLHENLLEDKEQFYVVTAINNLGEESGYSIEVFGTPLAIPTDIFNAPVRTQNDISLDYITTLLNRNKLLDVKPGSVTRQLHIDPNSYEFSLAYIRVDFAFRAQSLLTLRALDDADGDRISDDVTASTYKQNLKKAFFLQEDVDVQSMIDTEFDKRGQNTAVSRKLELPSNVELVFYILTRPSADIIVPLNTEAFTTASSTNAAIVFKTLSEQTMVFANIDQYWNPLEERYELKIMSQSINPGVINNVNSGTIINTSFSGLSVTNVSAAYDGADKESNADFADRMELSFVGLDIGTIGGYKKNVAAIYGVTDEKIIGAADPLMQRDWDEVRNKHVYGKVDIYIRGGVPQQFTDQIGFVYKQNSNELFEIIDATEFAIRSLNSQIVTYPLFYVSRIFNHTKANTYDLLGNWRVFKNTVEIVKGTSVNMDLATGDIAFAEALTKDDVITVTYDYKTDVAGEILIESASGGQTDFILINKPIKRNSVTVYLNETALLVNDYTLDRSTGFLQLDDPLAIGDELTVDYTYITRSTGEAVLTAIGGETTASLATPRVILESFLIDTDGITIYVDLTNFKNASIGMDLSDEIYVTYRYRASDSIVMLNQPVDSITSVTGSDSGTLEEGINYVFHKEDDILLEGNSVKSARYIDIIYANGNPAGNFTHISEDDIVLVNYTYMPLSQKGIYTETLIVKDLDGTITYSQNGDYFVRPEADGVNVSIAKTATTRIGSGRLVVDYDYGETFTIVYNTNPLIKTTQDSIESVRNITADVLVKGVLEAVLNLEFTVIAVAGSDSNVIKNDIRTVISNAINTKRLGEGIAQSDVVALIEAVTNVKSVQIPLTKMALADGTQINREFLTSSALTSDGTRRFSTTDNILLHSTLGSDDPTGFYQIFEDERPLIMTTYAGVDFAEGLGHISNAGKVSLSTRDGNPPLNHKYSVSYTVNNEMGANDIEITGLEYLGVGDIYITVAYQ